MLNSQWSSLWAIMGVLLIHSVAGVHSLCWCGEMDTQEKKMECLRACTADLSNESPVYPGNGHMKRLSENIFSALSRKKRYGGFMNSDTPPLLSLFKNATVKPACKKR